MLTNAQISEIIQQSLVAIWEKNIKEDYGGGWLLREDTLKNSLYFYLRKELGFLFEQNDIRLFTEFTGGDFAHSGYRPDMVIARVNLDYEGYWCDAITECLAIIEIKFKTGFSPNKDIYADYKKMETYIKDMKIPGHLYMATIWEHEDEETAWLEDEPIWAKGRVTELNASYLPGSDYEMRFYKVIH